MVLVAMNRILTQSLPDRLVVYIETFRPAIQEFRNDVGKYPGSLRLLSTNPQTVVGADDICNTALSATAQQRWRGPYVSEEVTGDISLRENLELLLNDLDRIPAAPTAASSTGELRMVFTNVSLATATEVEKRYDKTANSSTGAIIWRTVSTIPRMEFAMRIGGC